MSPAGIFNQIFTGWDYTRHFQALKGMPSTVEYADRQDHVRMVPSESPENRVSPS